MKFLPFSGESPKTDMAEKPTVHLILFTPLIYIEEKKGKASSLSGQNPINYIYVIGQESQPVDECP